MKLVNITPSEAVTLLYKYIDEYNRLPFAKTNFNNKGEIVKSFHNDIKSAMFILSGIVSQMIAKGGVDKSHMCSSVAGLKMCRESLRGCKSALTNEIYNERCASFMLDVINAIDSAVIHCEIVSATDQDGFVVIEYSLVTKINANLASLERYDETISIMRTVDI